MEETERTDIEQSKTDKPWLFKPGQSGNPAGRPKGQRDYATLYKEALIKLGELNGKEPDALELELISNGIASARKGDFRFYKDVLDRIHGQATQKNDVTSGGLPLILPATLINKNDPTSLTGDSGTGQA